MTKDSRKINTMIIDKNIKLISKLLSEIEKRYEAIKRGEKHKAFQ